MAKVFMLVLVCVFAIGMIGCGDDDDDSAVDNEAACNSLEDTLNELECAEGYDWALGCDAYSGDAYPCDISDYFGCLEDGATCDDSFDPPIVDISAWADCTAPSCD